MKERWEPKVSTTGLKVWENMVKKLLSSQCAVTLVGGGDLTPQTLSVALKSAPKVVAADGGAKSVLAQGLIPDAVIGDFDSLEIEMQAQIPSDRLHIISEQESTDFEKCLSRIEAPLILGVGFMGGRVDHELAVYSVLAQYPEQKCILVGEHDVVCAAPDYLQLALDIGTRVSLFPMASVTGKSEGLKWSLEGLTFAPNGQIGTSNEARDERVTLEFDRAGMLLILPRSCLGALMAAFTEDGTD